MAKSEPLVSPQELQRLLDKDAIRDLMADYARGVDRLDTTLLRRVYHRDALDDHGDYKGGLEGLLSYIAERTADAPQVMHFLGQTRIEFAEPDLALAETYFMTAHTLGSDAQQAFQLEVAEGDIQISMFGRYIDRVERRADAWTIVQRDTVFESTRLFTSGVPPVNPEWLAPRRDKSDVLWQRRAELGLR